MTRVCHQNEAFIRVKAAAKVTGPRAWTAGCEGHAGWLWKDACTQEVG